MNYQEWIDKIADLAGIYSFDILPDGSFSEIYVMALNKRNSVTMAMNPNAPKFYPGIPWRAFFTDLNFENYIYNSASKNEMLYSYANAHGFWVKGFYLPLTVESGEFSDAPPVMKMHEEFTASTSARLHRRWMPTQWHSIHLKLLLL